MSKLTNEQIQICKRNACTLDKMGLIIAMWTENKFDDLTFPKHCWHAGSKWYYIFNHYNLKQLQEML